MAHSKLVILQGPRRSVSRPQSDLWDFILKLLSAIAVKKKGPLIV